MEIIEHETRTSPDGLYRVEFYRSASGLFGFEQSTWTLEDMSDIGLDSDYYWCPSHVSGKYASLEDALDGAKAELPWYRDLVAS